MRNQSVFNVLVAPFLIVGICTNGMMTEVCFCGEQACLPSLRDKSKIQARPQFHNRCVGIDCKGCNLEQGRTLKAANTSTPISSLKIFDAKSIAFIWVDHPSIDRIDKGVVPFYFFRSVPSSPLYLQNLSLLC